MPNDYQIDEFFDLLDAQSESVAYEELLLMPGLSRRGAFERISFESRVSRNIVLKSPVVSAAMDTVTGARMAIKMALMGGIGVIHRNMDPPEQVQVVKEVKRYKQGRDDEPASMKETDTVGNLRELRARENYEFHSFFVLDSEGKMVGLVRRDAVDMAEDDATLGSVMLPFDQLVTAGPGTEWEAAYDLMRKHQVKTLPLVDAERKPRGMYSFRDLKERKGGHSLNTISGDGRLRVAAAIGMSRADREQALALDAAGCDLIVLDAATAYTEEAHAQVTWLKKNVRPDIMAGNICTADAGKYLVDAGADAVKVGMGPGSICTTREMTGVGVIQGSAVNSVARALRGTGVPVCADGGIRRPGQITIALAIGADTVMLGSMLAGTDEATGKIIHYQGRQYVTFRGMGSREAMLERQASRDRYRQGGLSVDKLVPEGIPGAVAPKGPVAGVLTQCLGGLKSGFGYVGATNIEELRHARIRRHAAGGAAESAVHDVVQLPQSSL